jgi:hypothetical protein
LYDASVAYFNWKIMKSFKCIRSTTPMRNTLKAIHTKKQGDKRAIDSVEAGISFKSRQ